MGEAIDHLKAAVVAAGGNLRVYWEGSDVYRLEASLPATGDTETLWLQWDADHEEPRFFFRDRDWMKQNTC